MQQLCLLGWAAARVQGAGHANACMLGVSVLAVPAARPLCPRSGMAAGGLASAARCPCPRPSSLTSPGAPPGRRSWRWPRILTRSGRQWRNARPTRPSSAGCALLALGSPILFAAPAQPTAFQLWVAVTLLASTPTACQPVSLPFARPPATSAWLHCLRCLRCHDTTGLPFPLFSGPAWAWARLPVSADLPAS